MMFVFNKMKIKIIIIDYLRDIMFDFKKLKSKMSLLILRGI